MEDEETTSISSSDGWQSNGTYFQLRQGTSWHEEMWNSCKHQIRTELPMGPCQHWQSIFCLHHGGILAKNRAKDDLCFLERCSFPCWILSIQPSLLAALYFRIASLQYPCHLSVGCMPLYGTRRYTDEDNLPCRLVKLSNCAKYFLIDIFVLAAIKHSSCPSY